MMSRVAHKRPTYLANYCLLVCLHDAKLHTSEQQALFRLASLGCGFSVFGGHC